MTTPFFFGNVISLRVIHKTMFVSVSKVKHRFTVPHGLTARRTLNDFLLFRQQFIETDEKMEYFERDLYIDMLTRYI